MATVTEFLSHFEAVRRVSGGWTARCPAHNDRRNSLGVSSSDSKILLHCYAGCDPKRVVEAVGLRMRDLFPDNEGRVEFITNSTATAQPASLANWCTLAEYGEYKNLPVEFLRKLGLSDIAYCGSKAVRIPYYNEDGTEGPVRFRLRLLTSVAGDGRFAWRKGSKPTLYGLSRLAEARKAGYVIRVEGESDCQTAWYHDLPAVGLPGVSIWREQWVEAFDGIPTIYDVIEPDQGGNAWLQRLSSSKLRDRVRIVRLDGVKDLSELHCTDPRQFETRIREALENATPWAEHIKSQSESTAIRAFQQCKELATSDRILDKFADALERCGVVGERRTSKILYLALTSRFLTRPVSVIVKGPSSARKSFITDRVLSFFPAKSFYALSAMSERALAYSEEPLSHRFLVIYEAAGLRGEFASYLIRSLLSEGCVRYETVEKTKDGMRPRVIERKGPTELIVTTTNLRLHSENETRMFSVPVTDTPEQTRSVLKAIAGTMGEPEVESWHALQEWLATANHQVVIPYAQNLAEKIPPIATRLRRDFTALLNLISAHAMLHQTQRNRNLHGSIIASLEDYQVVRDLVADLLAECVETTIAPPIRETVLAVQKLQEQSDQVSNTNIARLLGMDKSTVLRRVRSAIEKGYLRNEEERKGRPARLTCGEPMPDDMQVLPLVEELQIERDYCVADATH